MPIILGIFTPPAFGGRCHAAGGGLGPSSLLPPARLWAVSVDLVASETCVWSEANACYVVDLLGGSAGVLPVSVEATSVTSKSTPPCGPLLLVERPVAAPRSALRVAPST